MKIHCRQDSKVKRLLRQATFALRGSCQPIGIPCRRGLRKNKSRQPLASGQYLHRAHNIIVTAQQGAEKRTSHARVSQTSSEQHHTVRYYRLGQLLDELNIGHADGSYRQQLTKTR